MSPMITNARAYPIGVAAQRTGIHIETVRYYERIGLVPPPDRTPGGNRQYDEAALKRLFFIRRSRDLGFGIAEIKNLLKMVDDNDFTCAEIHAMTCGHMATIRDKIADLQRLEATLADMAARCGKGDRPECPILDTLFDNNTGRAMADRSPPPTGLT